ncbi:hypothetical protein A33Q_2447 [Indibacter alkaliphilus LW1]|uniref:CHAT domain-containing protein n=1 Tax=Indibacter alkaliphilus (strain CCUG 57479 / KCTC 22604 / LW1) TaxID=1189612 RepID=S2DBX1_INDAL|nr:CHAT domain-containing protein [Indibacter alkaliphilus]EOZ96677.1 hypothetical protein A33Q_2447 [Indibacter alkaliphilus LW1]
MDNQNSAPTLYQLLIDTIQAQNREQLAGIFKQYPNASLENALFFLEAKQHIYDLAAFDAMATSLTHGGKLNEGRDFASACLVWGVQLWSSGIELSNDDLEYYLGNNSYLIQKGLLDSGQFQAAVTQYETMKGLTLPGWEKQVFISTHLQAAENYLENNQSDRAKDILENVDESLVLPASRILFDRLMNKLKLINSKTFMSVAEVEDFSKNRKIQDLKRMLESIKIVMAGYEDQMDITSIEKLIAKHEGPGGISNEELIELTQKISAKTLESQAKLGGIDNSDTPQAKRHLLTQQTSFFHNEELGHKEELLRKCLMDLGLHYQWFFEKSLHSDLAFIAYCQYICHNRLESFQEAADALDKVYHHLEKQRASISNIHERAGVFGQYPALFGAMALTNYMSKNITRLFHRIEASKGRNLSDRLLETTGKQMELQSPDQLKEKLLPYLQKYNAHYLSIFVDYDRSYAVLLTKQGRLFASAKGAGEDALQKWLSRDYASPSAWNAPVSGLFGKREQTDIPLELGKFIDPLNFALEEGLIEAGDHIAYSPDGILNLFSLQFAKLQSGEALIEGFSVSRIHSGSQLLKLLEQEPQDLNEIIAITCSAVQDDEEKVKAFEEIPQFLLPEEDGAKEDEDVSIPKVLQVLFPHKLYHFSTHGVFPKPVANADHKQLNPYYNSGLLLMSDGKKPELEAMFNYHQGQHLLSPEVLTGSGVSLLGSHVSMQACVSGRSKEGYGGDALGLEWAFFYCGVSSMISASWDIDVDWSNLFFKKFYSIWMNEQIPIKDAHRNAVLELKKIVPVGPHPPEYYWAGLSLIGDFR